MKNSQFNALISGAIIWLNGLSSFCIYTNTKHVLKKSISIEVKTSKILLRSHENDFCGCCLNSEDYISNDHCINNLKESFNHRIPSISIIHVNRRKFVQCIAATSGIAGFTPLANALEMRSNRVLAHSSFVSAQNDMIAVRLGPLAPFSTTRKYRTIVLPNGLQVLLVKDSEAQQASVALSIDQAGQFSDPDEVPGLAHLMEHIVLSSSCGRTTVMQRKARKLWRNDKDVNRMNDLKKLEKLYGGDFEDWLADNEGDSNAFTAPSFVCFHFNAPHDVLPEGLERFARLFTLEAVGSTIQNSNIISREIDRVDLELDRTSDLSRAFYFLKSHFENSGHPFSRFSAGSKETLQTNPLRNEIDVSTYLLRFFRDHYIASKSTLVVVGNDELSALDKWISPFYNIMSQKSRFTDMCMDMSNFPNPIIQTNSKSSQTIMLRSKDDLQIDESIQTLSIEWPLSMSYYMKNSCTREPPTQHTITAPSVGFVVSQILSRKGPGSLHSLLEKFGWVPKGNFARGIPRISFPIDISGFQVLRMEIGLSFIGFANRSAVIAAVFEGIRSSVSRPLQLNLIKQYLSIAWLHGYLFAPRPPDSISLAVDALRFGIGGIGGIGVHGNWHLMPFPEDDQGAEKMRLVVSEILHTMANEDNAIICIRASPKAIFQHSQGIIDQKVVTSPLFPPWQSEPVTGARYLVENRANGGTSYFKSLLWFATKVDGDELTPPFINPLVPTKLRTPRPVMEKRVAWGRRFFYLEDMKQYEKPIINSDEIWTLTNTDLWHEYQTMESLHADSSDEMSVWKLWRIPPGYDNIIGLPLPMRPPEPSIEGVLVIQLLSSLPSTFTTTQLVIANLWLLSFDDDIIDLAELGAAAGLAYETSFNLAGLRLSFRGASQTLASYVRRFCRRFVQHHINLLSGSTKISDVVYRKAAIDANRSPKISRLQKNKVDYISSKFVERDIAYGGLFFLKSVNQGYLIAQGDVDPKESLRLLSELHLIFRDYIEESNSVMVNPELRDLMYKPYWKPRDSSPCLLPGVSLISDSCGRIPR